MLAYHDVLEARQRISPYVRRTPLIKSVTLSRDLDTNVYLKYELFQKTGSFKPRGAFNQLLQLSPQQCRVGVVAVSGGNYAQAVAYAAKVLGVRTLICMPAYTPKNYLAATKSYGAEVEILPTIADAFERVREYQEQGWTPTHPYDDPHLMAGNGTLGLELAEDLPEVTDVLISIGGGGLLGGNLVSLKGIKPEVRIWGVETEGSDTMGQALRAGKPVPIQPASLAKTLGAPIISEDALHLAQQYLERHVLVTDREAFAAELYLLERTKVITELAASCTLAAARQLKGAFGEDNHVVLVLCGGNASLDNLMEYRQKLGEV